MGTLTYIMQWLPPREMRTLCMCKNDEMSAIVLHPSKISMWWDEWLSICWKTRTSAIHSSAHIHLPLNARKKQLTFIQAKFVIIKSIVKSIKTTRNYAICPLVQVRTCILYTPDFSSMLKLHYIIWYKGSSAHLPLIKYYYYHYYCSIYTHTIHKSTTKYQFSDTQDISCGLYSYWNARYEKYMSQYLSAARYGHKASTACSGKQLS